jgi:hypothetical protein
MYAISAPALGMKAVLLNVYVWDCLATKSASALSLVGNTLEGVGNECRTVHTP